MKYHELKNRILDNCNLENADTRELRKINNAIVDTLRDLYSESEAPRTEISYTIEETEDIVEDFADTTYIDNFEIVENFTFSTNKLATPADSTGICKVTHLKDVSKVTVNAGGNASGIVENFGTVKVEVLNELDEVLFEEEQSMTQNDGDFEDFDFVVGVSGTNLILKVSITTASGSDGYSAGYLKGLTLTVNDNSLLLPEDFYIPLMVTFKELSTGKPIASSEIPYNRYSRWMPNALFSTTEEDEGDNESQITDLKVHYGTSENVDFDRTIGYTFNTTTSGTYLLWKPKFRGVITIAYAHLPSFSTSEASTIEINTVFANCLANGATVRRLRQLITSEKNEIRLQALVIALRDYKADYQREITKYIAFTKRTTSAPAIVPFDFLNDPNMLR